jgi:hypothetical protein
MKKIENKNIPEQSGAESSVVQCKHIKTIIAVAINSQLIAIIFQQLLIESVSQWIPIIN